MVPGPVPILPAEAAISAAVSAHVAFQFPYDVYRRDPWLQGAGRLLGLCPGIARIHGIPPRRPGRGCQVEPGRPSRRHRGGRLLGTGSADRSANTFSGASCLPRRARPPGQGPERGPACLVDEVPCCLRLQQDKPRQSVRAGRSLGTVTDVYVSHARHRPLSTRPYLLPRVRQTTSPSRSSVPGRIVNALPTLGRAGDEKTTSP